MTDSSASTVEIAKGNTLSTGGSSPKAFKDGYFDYNFARFLGLCPYSGAEIGECFATAHRIIDGDVESWVREWTATAQRVEALAEDSFKRGHKFSAREAWLRATTYYQAAFFFVLDGDPRKPELYQKHTGCFQKAAPLFNPPIEPLAIPYRDDRDGNKEKSLFGYFVRPDPRDFPGPRPTVLIQMGADGSSEQIYFSGGGAAAARRGYNAIIFEGPGQTGTFMRDRTLTYRFDWEKPVAAVVDFALTRSELVDPQRIALIAYSMGGYLGPRAAAFEKRLAATIVSGLVPEIKGLAKGFEDAEAARAAGKPPNHSHRWLLNEHMPKWGLNGGFDDVPKLREMSGNCVLYGLEDKITCPLLVVQAAAEGDETTNRAKAFFDKLPNPKNKFRLTTVEDGADMHCQKGNASLLHAIEFDWLEEVMG
ncbi:uncharacterized protein Z520_03945 [Fonsecaea multimorphosa CBS 102226]|uniref:AB hydrolase-1 domain-containing protein n=1 Tax=Fonsecaea multimorphosa CBS 102226 TaxID=1442371 RepID=A0A0D2KAT6_9EURO|nr:uncharacterized protein Z520_03945 [Fonsecaea multimorphosa CBS 102226]KIY00260.1 hypothetical protein Z520_03945 [Fonsecaea multimorphosa CBS 102226]OAL27096.1 hypothetical protein AYO22_03727 [Fonsecaea multimorphosa]